MWPFSKKESNNMKGTTTFTTVSSNGGEPIVTKDGLPKNVDITIEHNTHTAGSQVVGLVTALVTLFGLNWFLHKADRMINETALDKAARYQRENDAAEAKKQNKQKKKQSRADNVVDAEFEEV